MDAIDTDTENKMTFEAFEALQVKAIGFLNDVLEGNISGTEDELKARIIAAQTLLGVEPPLDTEKFIANIREQLHQELRNAGLDVDGALGQKRVVTG